MHPGEYLLDDGEVELNTGRPTAQVVVSNRGDRPVQVGSHYHFFESEFGAAFRSRRGLWHAAGYRRRHGDPF